MGRCRGGYPPSRGYPAAVRPPRPTRWLVVVVAVATSVWWVGAAVWPSASPAVQTPCGRRCRGTVRGDVVDRGGCRPPGGSLRVYGVSIGWCTRAGGSRRPPRGPVACGEDLHLLWRRRWWRRRCGGGGCDRLGRVPRPGGRASSVAVCHGDGEKGGRSRRRRRGRHLRPPGPTRMRRWWWHRQPWPPRPCWVMGRPTLWCTAVAVAARFWGATAAPPPRRVRAGRPRRELPAPLSPPYACGGRGWRGRQRWVPLRPMSPLCGGHVVAVFHESPSWRAL